MKQPDPTITANQCDGCRRGLPNVGGYHDWSRVYGYAPGTRLQCTKWRYICPCGKPLHYTNTESRRIMDQLCAELGNTMKVSLSDRSWRVPRHYIALHGIKGSELAALADKFGWEEIKQPERMPPKDFLTTGKKNG